MARTRSARFMHTFYLLIIAILATLLFVERQSREPVPSPSVEEQLSNLQQGFEQRLNEVESNITARLEQYRTAQPATDDAARRSTAPPASAQNPPINRRLDPQEEASVENETESETETQQRTDQANLHASLSASLLNDFAEKEAQFSIQSVDPDWAYPTRDLIQEQFNQNTYLQTLNLSNIECRSSLCQVDIEAQDQVTVNPARLIRALNTINQNQHNYRYAFRNSSQDDIYRVIVERIEDRNQ